MRAYSDEPMYLAIDQKRLLKELPAFFKSFGDAVAELIQNSYRANASEVKILVNYDTRQLIVEDNGKGAPSPLPLVTAGTTGWNEEVVVDPAGLGLFALLGLSEEVVVESRAEGYQGWKIVITKECFDGVPIQAVKSDYYEGPSPCGVRISATINNKANMNLVTSTTILGNFRHLFPLNVILTEIKGEQKETKVYPPVVFSTPYIDSIAGKFYIDPFTDTSHLFTREPLVVWEHRVLSGEGLNKDISAELCKFPGGVYVANLLSKRYVWVVDSDTGVRPKLPDRRELIHDEAYKSAVASLAVSIYNAFDVERVKEQLNKLGLDDVLSESTLISLDKKLREVSKTIHQVFVHNTDTLLKLAGYKTCQYQDYPSFYFHSNGDETYSDISDVEYRVRNPRIIGDMGIAQAMSRCGVWALARGDEPVQLQIPNITLAQFHNVYIGTCDKIEVVVDGKVIATLPYLCEIDDILPESLPETLQELYSAGLFLVAGISPAEFVQKVGPDLDDFVPWLIYALYQDCNLDEYVEDWSDGVVGETQLINDLKTTLYAEWFPDLAADQSRYSKLAGLLSDLSTAKCGTMNLEWCTSRLMKEYPELTNELTPILSAIEVIKSVSIDLAKWEVKCQNI